MCVCVYKYLKWILIFYRWTYSVSFLKTTSAICRHLGVITENGKWQLYFRCRTVGLLSVWSLLVGESWMMCWRSDEIPTWDFERHLFYFDLNHSLLFSPPSISVWVMSHLLLSFPSSCQPFGAQLSFFLIFPPELLDFITLRYFDRASDAPTPRGRGRLCLLVVATEADWLAGCYWCSWSRRQLCRPIAQSFRLVFKPEMKDYFERYLVFFSWIQIWFCVILYLVVIEAPLSQLKW